MPPLEVMWRRSLGAVVQQPLIAQGTIFVPVEHGGRQYDRPVRLLALDAATGHERWRLEDVGGWSLAYEAGRLFVGRSGALAAFDATNGNPLWSVVVEDSGGVGRPIASDGLVYAVDGRDSVFAFEAATGKLVWRQKASQAGQTHPTVAGGRVFTSSSCTTHAFDARTGEHQWDHDRCSGGSDAIAAVHAGLVYVHEQPSFHNEPALDAETGSIAGATLAATVFAPGIGVWQGDKDGSRVEALDLSTGQTIWSAYVRSPGSEFRVRPTAVGATLWSLDYEGKLSGYGLRTGDLRERIPLFGDDFLGVSSARLVSLVADDGVLVVPASGDLFALRSAIRPGPGTIGVRLSLTDFLIGGLTRLDGRLGDELAGERVQLEVDPYPYGRFRTAGSSSVDPGDRTFRFRRLRPDRNTRYRVRAVGAPTASPVVKAYVVPRLRLSVRDTGRVFHARARVRGAAGVRLGGRRLVVYAARLRKRVYERLGSARLRPAGRSRASAVLSLRRVRFGPGDRVAFCISGLRGMGRSDRLTRRCGAARVRG